MSKSTRNFIIVILAFVLVFALLPSFKNALSGLSEENTDESTAIDESNEESSDIDMESSEEESSEEESSEESTEEETIVRATYELDYMLNPDETSYAVTGFANISGAENGIELVIPSEHDGLPVTVIETDAFGENDNIISVSIPETIKSIGSGAFENCSNLSYIYFNAAEMNDLTVSPFMFSGHGSDGITVLIGNKVARVPNYLFGPNYPGYDHSPHITSVNFEENSICTEIGSGSFYYNMGLNFTAPSSLVKVGSNGLICVGSSTFDFSACREVLTFEGETFAHFYNFTVYVSQEHYKAYRNLPIFSSYQDRIFVK